MSSILTSTEYSDINKLLRSHGLNPISSSMICVYYKASINGKTFFSKDNKQVKLWNSYTITFSLHIRNIAVRNY